MSIGVGESIATVFTFLAFIFIIIAPMAMTFFKAKIRDSDAPSDTEAELGSKGPGGTGEKKKPKNLLIELLRRADREDEPEVHFSTPRGASKDAPAGASGGASTGVVAPERGRSRRSSAGHRSSRSSMEFSQPLETEFRDFEKDLGKPFTSFEEGRNAADAAERYGEQSPAGLPDTSSVRRLVSLSELKRAVVMAEILGPPKGLGDEEW